MRSILVKLVLLFALPCVTLAQESKPAKPAGAKRARITFPFPRKPDLENFRKRMQSAVSDVDVTGSLKKPRKPRKP